MPFVAHFRLKERPFRLTHNSELYYPSAAHQEVLGSLAYAVERGEVSTGKALLCRMVTAGLVKTAAVAYITTPQANADWVIGAVCREFGLNPDGTSDPLHMLNGFLLEQFAAKRRVLVVVDEAQALGIVGVETVRRLSNLETDETKLLQIVLFGQPKLDRLLADRALRQLNQRIVFSFTISALGADDTADYIHHRVRSAGENGAADPSLLDDRAVKARANQGIPRVINIIADKSLLAAFGQGANKVTAQHVSDAVKDSCLVIESLPDRDSGGWGQRALNALNRWAADNAPLPPGRATTQPSVAVRPDITLGKAADECLAAREDRNLKPATLSERQRHVETYFRPKLGTDRAADIIADTIRGLAREWIQALPAGYAGRVLASLNSIFVEGVRRHHITTNPVRGIRIEGPAKVTKPLASPGAAELRSLLDTAKPDLAALIATATLTGLRADELRALTWDNIDLTAGHDSCAAYGRGPRWHCCRQTQCRPAQRAPDASGRRSARQMANGERARPNESGVPRQGRHHAVQCHVSTRPLRAPAKEMRHNRRRRQAIIPLRRPAPWRGHVVHRTGLDSAPAPRHPWRGQYHHHRAPLWRIVRPRRR